MGILFEYAEILFFVLLFLVGFFAGRWNEGRHYASLRRREKELGALLIFSNRFPPAGVTWRDTRLVAGSAVISDDYFKSVLAGLYSLFGGRMKSYESLLDRARREAVLRMKAEARAMGAGIIVNVKFQTFAIGGKVKGFELLAYGTALVSGARGQLG